MSVGAEAVVKECRLEALVVVKRAVVKLRTTIQALHKSNVRNATPCMSITTSLF